MNTTSRQLFFELLHQGRHIKSVLAAVPSMDSRLSKLGRKMYILGIRRALENHLEDIKIAEGMRDYWRNQNSGAER